VIPEAGGTCLAQARAAERDRARHPGLIRAGSWPGWSGGVVIVEYLFSYPRESGGDAWSTRCATVTSPMVQVLAMTIAVCLRGGSGTLIADILSILFTPASEDGDRVMNVLTPASLRRIGSQRRLVTGARDHRGSSPWPAIIGPSWFAP